MSSITFSNKLFFLFSIETLVKSTGIEEARGIGASPLSW